MRYAFHSLSFLHGKTVSALWSALGVVSLGLGALGVLLPILPTTPFVILAAFAFGKSTPALHHRLKHHRVFGPMITDWEASGAIAPRYKALAITMMASAFAASVVMSVSTTILVVQALCMAGAATFILSRPNRAAREQQPTAMRPAANMPGQIARPGNHGGRNAFTSQRSGAQCNDDTRDG